MKGFKGFDKDLKCRGFQYTVGETTTHDGTVSLCDSGLHFFKSPLSTFTFYKPGDSRYAEVEADGVSNSGEKDGKWVAKSLHVKAELKIPALVEAATEFVFQKVKPSEGDSAHAATTGYYAHAATTGDSAHAATTGYYAHAATTGDYAHAATTGDYAHAATTGYYAHAATTGDSAHAATTGYYAHAATTGDSAHAATTGDSAHAATTGYSAHAATTGDYAHAATTGDYARASAMGKQSIAASLGRNGAAKGPKGGWLVLSEIGDDLKVKGVGVARVDGKKIKADTYYQIEGGKFIEAKD